MDYNSIAKQIIELVGGNDNIEDVSICATRLRFVLRDNKNADTEGIEKIDIVKSIMTTGGQFQIVIGPDVAKVYKEINNLINIDEIESSQDSIGTKGNLLNRLLAYISATITPLLLPLLGSSVIKVILTLLLQFDLITYESGIYTVLNAASSAVFTFLPVLCAFSCARYLKCNQFIAACIGAALMEPTLTALADTTISFLGIPIRMFDYSSTVFPAMFAVGVYAIAERYMNKKINSEIVKQFVVPLVALIVFVPLTLMIFGPFSYYVGEGILAAYHALESVSPILMGIIFGGTFWFAVVFGVHWALVPIVIADLTTGSSALAGVYITGNIALWGVTLGLIWACKDKTERAEYITHFLTVCVAGVTEPFLYGCVLKSKRIMATTFFGGAVGGALLGSIHNAGLAYTYTNIFTVPTLWVNDNYALYILYVLITVAIGVLLTRFWGAKDVLNEQTTRS